MYKGVQYVYTGVTLACGLRRACFVVVLFALPFPLACIPTQIICARCLSPNEIHLLFGSLGLGLVPRRKEYFPILVNNVASCKQRWLVHASSYVDRGHGLVWCRLHWALGWVIWMSG
mgnify:FL=1